MNAIKQEAGWNSVPEETRGLFTRLEEADGSGREEILTALSRDDLSKALREVACASRMELRKRVDAPIDPHFPIGTIEEVLRSMRANLRTK
jgi:hypothetical protein